MKTELFTVSKIFTENLFRIPDYQRGYSWGTDQLKDFWLDLEQLDADSNHYTGVLTVEEVDESIWKKWEDDIWIIQSRKYKPYYIVDGQQRVTTIIILIQVILELINDKTLNYTPNADIRRKYIFDAKVEDAARSYIFGYEKDNPSYEYLKTKIFLENSDIHLPTEVTIYTKNLLAAKNFFQEKIESLSHKKIEELYTKVTQQLVFNVYEISEDIDVFVTFETMNNRGKPLSTLELLKNRLIYLSTKLVSDKAKNSRLRRQINDAWKSAYHYLGKNDARPLKDDKFLETHFFNYYIKKLVSYDTSKSEDERDRYRRQLNSRAEELNRFLLNVLFTTKRIKSTDSKATALPELNIELISNFAQSLKDSVELYYKLSTPDISNFSQEECIQLERIGRLVGYNPSPMLMALYQSERNSAKRVKVLTSFERLLFCQSFGMRTPHYFRNFKSSSVDFIDYANGSITSDELNSLFENIVTELIKETPLTETIADWVKNGDGYYGWRPIRFFLFEYELHLKAKTRTARDKLDWKEFSKENYEHDYVTVEHIYPQRARDKYWTDRFSSFNPTQKRLLRNSLGNLLPLATAKNSSLSNKDFITKRDGDGDKLVGYKYGCYSEIDVAQLDEWNSEAILNRGLQLLTFLENRWGLNIGDKTQKIKALGLNFLIK